MFFLFFRRNFTPGKALWFYCYKADHSIDNIVFNYNHISTLELKGEMKLHPRRTVNYALNLIESWPVSFFLQSECSESEKPFHRYIPSQKRDLKSILYTSWWDKNIKKSTIQKVLRTLILHINNNLHKY